MRRPFPLASRRGPAAAAALALGAVALAPACEATPRFDPALLQEPGSRPTVDVEHRGPEVHYADSGTQRFVPALYDAFRPTRAMATVELADPYFRAPASPGYDAVLDHVVETLRAAGFGQEPRLTLEVLEEDEATASWTPKRGRLVLHAEGAEPRVLHAFDAEAGRDRTMLPVHAPSCSIEGDVALSLADLQEGDVLVTEASLRQVLARARSQGAAAVLSSSLYTFNVDPTGAERHLDAIQFVEVDPGTDLPVGQISPRAYAAIAEAAEAGDARVRLEAEVAVEERPLRTVVATVVGAERPDEVIAISSHVQEPGACDNASGTAGLLEGARSLAVLLREGELAWPGRSLAFLWGDEFHQTETWLASTDRTPVAGISSDMTGQSAETGAIALLERHPDPGALSVLPPDEHTPWGAWEVEPEWVMPNGLAVVARCALADVEVHSGTPWPTADHPWEGGSDHDVYIKRGVPGALFWHFTDFTYHTSLDRTEFVDPEEMRRTGVAVLATALAVAAPEPGDLDRYLRSLRLEEDVRTAAAEEAGHDDNARAWREWCYGARMWLRQLCLGPEADEPPREAGATSDGGSQDGSRDDSQDDSQDDSR